MVTLTCKNFGFDCTFEVENADDSKQRKSFANHVSLEHQVNLSEEFLEEGLSKTGIFCPYCNSEFEAKETLSSHIDKIHNEYGVLEGGIGGF